LPGPLSYSSLIAADFVVDLLHCCITLSFIKPGLDPLEFQAFSWVEEPAYSLTISWKILSSKPLTFLGQRRFFPKFRLNFRFTGR